MLTKWQLLTAASGTSDLSIAPFCSIRINQSCVVKRHTRIYINIRRGLTTVTRIWLSLVSLNEPHVSQGKKLHCECNVPVCVCVYPAMRLYAWKYVTNLFSIGTSESHVNIKIILSISSTAKHFIHCRFCTKFEIIFSFLFRKEKPYVRTYHRKNVRILCYPIRIMPITNPTELIGSLWWNWTSNKRCLSVEARRTLSEGNVSFHILSKAELRQQEKKKLLTSHLKMCVVCVTMTFLHLDIHRTKSFATLKLLLPAETKAWKLIWIRWEILATKFSDIKVSYKW